MRVSTRFNPDPLAYALIDFDGENKAFKPTTVGLIMNESYTGCRLVVNTDEIIKVGMDIRIQVGKIGVLNAKIVWIKVLDESVVQIGVNLLE